MDRERIVEELRRYKTDLEAVLGRFVRSTDALHMHPADERRYRQIVHELVDLFDQVFGSNRHSWNVEHEFRQGLNNFLLERQDYGYGRWAKANLIVECDGHDFHEKTKEQVQRDKSRDRILQSCGFPVFHFTGSEIWRDAFKCAESILDIMATKTEKELKELKRLQMKGGDSG